MSSQKPTRPNRPTGSSTSSDGGSTNQRQAEGGADELQPGSQIGNYIIDALTSRGGFASIYKARHLRIGRVAALKVLHAHLAELPDVLTRFQREAQLVNFIRHPNIIDIYEFGDLTDGRPYIVMEWLEGRNLDEELEARGRLNLSDAIAIIEDVGAALAAAHRVGVIHRDVKASNVMAVPVGRWFAVKLVDFGIAKLVDSALAHEELTTKGMTIGTPWTMAPEQILGLPVDARTDIYALGILFYQLLAGSLPFAAATPSRVQSLHLKAEPPSLPLLTDAPPAVNRIIRRCMEKEKEKRYPSIDALVADLRRVDTERTTPRPGPARCLAIGLYVEVRIDESVDIDDSTVADCDAALAEARLACASAQLNEAAAGPTSLLAVALLPADEAARRALQERVLTEALQIGARSRSPRVQLLVAVHVASVIARTGYNQLKLLGGDLLAPSTWARDFPVGSVTVSMPALFGVEEKFVIEHLADHADAVRLVAAM